MSCVYQSQATAWLPSRMIQEREAEPRVTPVLSGLAVEWAGAAPARVTETFLVSSRDTQNEEKGKEKRAGVRKHGVLSPSKNNILKVFSEGAAEKA